MLRPSFAAPFLAPLAAVAAATALVTAVACSTTVPTTTGVTPVTGIVIRSDLLVTGFGCGPNPTQVFKYVAIASTNGQALYSNIFDCFADGVFVNLPATGDQKFTIQILAFNKDDYARQQCAIEPAAGNPVQVATFVPTWSTNCVATQQFNVAVLAVCDPLSRADAGTPPNLCNVGAGDAGDAGDAGAAPGDAGGDAAADAPSDSATKDAGDAGAAGDAADAASDAGVDAASDAGDAAVDG